MTATGPRGLSSFAPLRLCLFIPGQHDTAARFQYHACHGQAHAAGTADDEQFFTFEKVFIF